MTSSIEGAEILTQSYYALKEKEKVANALQWGGGSHTAFVFSLRIQWMVLQEWTDGE